MIQYDAKMSCAHLQLSPHSQILRKQTLHKLRWPWIHQQSLTSTLLALTRHHVWDLQATFIRLHICSLTISVLTAECFDLGFFQGSPFFLLKFVRMNMKRLIWVTFGVYVFGGDSGCIVSCSFPKSDMKRNITFEVYIWYETHTNIWFEIIWYKSHASELQSWQCMLSVQVGQTRGLPVAFEVFRW